MKLEDEIQKILHDMSNNSMALFGLIEKFKNTHRVKDIVPIDLFEKKVIEVTNELKCAKKIFREINLK